MDKVEARELLKSNGYKLRDVAEYLGIKPDSLSTRWSKGLDVNQVLLLYGFLALQDDFMEKCLRHRKALAGLLEELDDK